MKYLHDRNIIHRDLKTDNILLDEDFHPHITDFGLSKFYETGNSYSQTRFGGTLSYEAPEILRGTKYSKKVDIYSYGILMFEVLTDSVPYPDLEKREITGLEFMNKVVNENYRPNFNVPVKKSLKNLIERCWSENQDERPTFEEIFYKLANKHVGGKYDDGNNYLLDDVDVDELNLYVEDVTEITDATEKHLSRISEVEKENKQLKNEIKELRNIIETEKNKVRSILNKAENDKSNLQSRLNKVENERNNLQSRLNEVQNNLNNLKNRMNKSENDKQNLQERINQVENDRNILLGRLNQYEKEKYNLQGRLNIIENERNNLRIRLNEKENKDIKFAHNVRALPSLAKIIQINMKQSPEAVDEAILREIEERDERLKQAKEDLQEEKANCEGKIQKYQLINDSLNKEKENLQGQIQAILSEKESEAIDQLMRQLKKLSELFAEMTNEAADLRERLAKSKDALFADRVRQNFKYTHDDEEIADIIDADASLLNSLMRLLKPDATPDETKLWRHRLISSINNLTQNQDLMNEMRNMFDLASKERLPSAVAGMKSEDNELAQKSSKILEQALKKINDKPEIDALMIVSFVLFTTFMLKPPMKEYSIEEEDEEV